MSFRHAVALPRPELVPLHLKIRLRRVGKPVLPNPPVIAHKLASRRAREAAKPVQVEAERLMRLAARKRADAAASAADAGAFEQTVQSDEGVPPNAGASTGSADSPSDAAIQVPMEGGDDGQNRHAGGDPTGDGGEGATGERRKRRAAAARVSYALGDDEDDDDDALDAGAMVDDDDSVVGASDEDDDVEDGSADGGAVEEVDASSDGKVVIPLELLDSLDPSEYAHHGLFHAFDWKMPADGQSRAVARRLARGQDPSGKRKAADSGTEGDADDDGLALDGDAEESSPTASGQVAGSGGAAPNTKVYDLKSIKVVEEADEDAISTSDDESVMTDIVRCMDDAALLAYEDERHGADDFILYGIRAQDRSLWVPLMPERLQVGAARVGSMAPNDMLIAAGNILNKMQQEAAEANGDAGDDAYEQRRREEEEARE